MRALVVAASLAFAFPALAQESPPSTRPTAKLAADFNFLLGTKVLDREEWGKDLSNQFLTGLETTWGKPSWRVGIAADALFANAEKRRGTFSEEEVTRGSTLELAVGARAILPLGRVRPFFGAGAEIAQGDVQVLRRADSDEAHGGGATGWWAGGGVFGRFGKTANVGLSVRWSTARAKASGFDKDAGGMVYAVTFGFGIPPFATGEE